MWQLPEWTKRVFCPCVPLKTYWYKNSFHKPCSKRLQSCTLCPHWGCSGAHVSAGRPNCRPYLVPCTNLGRKVWDQVEANGGCWTTKQCHSALWCAFPGDIFFSFHLHHVLRCPLSNVVLFCLLFVRWRQRSWKTSRGDCLTACCCSACRNFWCKHVKYFFLFSIVCTLCSFYLHCRVSLMKCKCGNETYLNKWMHHDLLTNVWGDFWPMYIQKICGEARVHKHTNK